MSIWKYLLLRQAMYVLIVHHLLQKGGELINTAKLFQNGNSQAIRIPQKYRMPGTEVLISPKGENIILVPVPANREMLFSALDEFPEDFMATGRLQPDAQTR